MTRTTQQLDAAGKQFVASLDGMSRSAAAKQVAKKFHGSATEAMFGPVGATGGDRLAVLAALVWARSAVDALEALDALK